MPPKRKKRSQQSSRPTRQSARQAKTLEEGIPEEYRDVLAKAIAEERIKPPPAKRRKVSEEPSSSKIELDVDLFGDPSDVGDGAPRLEQVVFRDSDSEAESDAAFENVDLDAPADAAFEDAEPEKAPLEVNLSRAPGTPARAAQKRKPVGAAERRRRLAIHKTHIVMLLAHLRTRNRWCNSEVVHATLKPLATKKTISLLHVDESRPQYERNQSFMKGLDDLDLSWRTAWRRTERGMRRPYWKDDADMPNYDNIDEDEELDYDGFLAAAAKKDGSRDLGAQMFCAWLRSLAIDTRLVCSLQVLPFSGVAKGQTPEKSKAEDYIYAPPQDFGESVHSTAKKERWLERSESHYPVFWVEVFSQATQNWIPVDPLVRHTINKPKTGFEPPANDRQNGMSYVIAFEDDGSAKDVTLRYTQFYNSKTLRHRVESTPGGAQWWTATMQTLEKQFREPRDDIEEAFLLKRTEAEPMPKNIADFKGHSIYVLERHLHLNQVIHPKREAGKVSIGGGLSSKLEPVYRRKDVHVCRTADAWYRRGRDVNEGEQPLKRASPKRRRDLTAEDLEDDPDLAEGSALYAEFQTSVYVPPPVVDGRIPRNAYGNLDVYVPSMIPAGAIHVRHPLAAQAARILGINYADAVTGFQFKGRKGTAVIDGVVVAMTMTNAIKTVIEGLEEQVSEEVQEARSQFILATWKRWLTALRIREHVRTQYGSGMVEGKGKEKAVEHVVDEGESEDDETYRPEADGGGFMLEADESVEDEDVVPQSVPRDLRPLDDLLPAEVVHQEIIVVRSPHKLPKQIIPLSPPTSMAVQVAPNKEYDGSLYGSDESGGFIPDEEEGGGFLPEGDDDDDERGQGTQIPDLSAHLPSNTTEAANEDVRGGAFLPSDENPLPPTTQTNHPPQPEPNKSKDLEVRDPPNHSISVPSPKNLNDDDSPAAIAESPASTTESRLSHDPDEDDAEPEWLLSSLGEIE